MSARSGAMPQACCIEPVNSGSNESKKLVIVKHDRSERCAIHGCKLHLRLRVPCRFQAFPAWEAAVTLGWDPGHKPLDVIAVPGSSFYPVQRRVDGEEAVVEREWWLRVGIDIHFIVFA